ncbi:MAG: GntP family permease [Saprospiraceae bacterium]|nr:GntP family permease [Saprospiraceae bacterium]
MSPVLILLLGLAVVLFCIVVLKLHAFISLTLAAIAVGAVTTPEILFDYAVSQGMTDEQATTYSNQLLSQRVVTAFGNTCAKVGILIAMASIIGASLLKSGGAERIVRGALQLFGKKNAPAAFLSGSFILAIPVFFDTVFYLMIPLVKSFGIRNPKKFSLYLMCVIAGGVMAHSLVPPTPGPLFVAQELGVDLGIMMIMGIVIGTITILAGYAYALYASKRWSLPLRDTAEAPLDELEATTTKSNSELPSLLFSLTPILLPVILIAGNTILKATIGTSSSGTGVLKIASILGDSNLALTFSAMISLYLLYRYTVDKSDLQKYVQAALSSAGVIILITASGGALGALLQQSGIGNAVKEMAANYQLAVLPLAFIATAVVRTAQGSATVAMITAIGILGGLASGDALDFHPVYLALAIGCGSKLFPWMNDSGFWIVTKMAGMTEKESIRFFSFLLSIMGIAGLLAVMIFARILPLV